MKLFLFMWIKVLEITVAVTGRTNKFWKTTVLLRKYFFFSYIKCVIYYYMDIASLYIYTYIFTKIIVCSLVLLCRVSYDTCDLSYSCLQKTVNHWNDFLQYVGKQIKSVFQCTAYLVQKLECFVVKLMFLGF